MGRIERGVAALVVVFALTSCRGENNVKTPIVSAYDKNIPALISPTCSPDVVTHTQSIEDNILFTTDDLPSYDLHISNVATLISVIQNDIELGLTYGHIRHSQSTSVVSTTPINYVESRLPSLKLAPQAINIAVLCNQEAFNSNGDTLQDMVTLQYSEEVITVIAAPPMEIQNSGDGLLSHINQGIVARLTEGHLRSSGISREVTQDIAYGYGLAYFVIRDAGLTTYEEYIRFIQESVDLDSSPEEDFVIPVVSRQTFEGILRVLNNGDIMQHRATGQI